MENDGRCDAGSGEVLSRSRQFGALALVISVMWTGAGCGTPGAEVETVASSSTSTSTALDPRTAVAPAGSEGEPGDVAVEEGLAGYATARDPWLIQCEDGIVAQAVLATFADGSSGSRDFVETARRWLHPSEERALRKLVFEDVEPAAFRSDIVGSNPGIRGFDVLLIDSDNQAFAQLYAEQTRDGGYLAPLFVTCPTRR